MEPSILVIALVCGFLCSRVGLPSLIGYLAAGFALYALGFADSQLPLLKQLSDLGVLLLLFAIGLKLDLRSLAKAQVWGGASAHLLISLLVFVPFLKILGYLGLSQLAALETWQMLLLAFALGFSSTVFAVKILEDKGEMGSLYGQIAIGVLVMQDVFAVVFMTISKGEWPSVWALALFLIPLCKPLIYRLLDHMERGDLLVLFGLVMALVLGANLFEAVGIKPDLGALLMGVLLANHPRSSELAKSLFELKELLLVAFFLTVGLNGLPSSQDLTLSVLLLLLLPFKTLLFFWLFTRFKLRARTSLLASLSLTNFSEFGLIVASVATYKGWLPPEFVVVLAIALSMSFLIAAPLNRYSEVMYQVWQPIWHRWQSSELSRDDQPIDLGKPKFIILGMGRIGGGAYDELVQRYGECVVGIDHKPELVQMHRDLGRNVIQGDAVDTDFWHKITPHSATELVLLAMPHHHGNLTALDQLKQSSYTGKVAAIVQYESEVEPLKEQGVEAIYNVFEAAGAGFAEHVAYELMPEHRTQDYVCPSQTNLCDDSNDKVESAKS
ncbi:cation:proton antiporter family protein [Paraferrimonas sedimenticola]|uniref:Potassium transporter Kef n=1 Tax=Paraferrimonas sedimenticola TaxID=375674 RepID=A0AA37RVD1_9GAMM|nr:cation:proton antiporter family protein [Paraferrimonas sedimenticola]GLP95763.1 potassium transporter Kef [Paraferrimonas sedimenticola]